jgi:8-oxo-dGTP pyrophosphatase MutT (NUDIX family)
MEAAIDQVIAELKHQLRRALPGHSSHDRMKPSHGEQTRRLSQDCREAAVLVLLVPSAGGLGVVLTQRHDDIKDHAGQIAFPGGVREGGETFEEAAVRECYEEIGVAASQFELLGPLTPLYIPPSNFCVHPHLAVSSVRLAYRLQPDEVAEVFEIPVRRLRDPAVQSREWTTYRGRRIAIPVFRIDGRRIWGATAMILAELLDLFEELNETP